MTESMEQQIINSINSRWTKNKEKRVEINIDRVSDAFRVIASSRASTLAIISKINKENYDYTNELKENLNGIYKWITDDSINSIKEKFAKPLLDRKKEAEYLAELPHISNFLDEFKANLIEVTTDKLLKFHNVSEVK